jgi:hypothetical protein
MILVGQLAKVNRWNENIDMGITVEWKEKNKSEHHLCVLYFVSSIYMAKVYSILYFPQYKTPIIIPEIEYWGFTKWYEWKDRRENPVGNERGRHIGRISTLRWTTERESIWASENADYRQKYSKATVKKRLVQMGKGALKGRDDM